MEMKYGKCEWKTVFSSRPTQSSSFLEAMKGVEPLSFGLQDRRSVIQLSYIAKRVLVDWEGFKPSQEVCRTSMLSLHHQPGTCVICHRTFFIGH